jgi:hypothetical protein
MKNHTLKNAAQVELRDAIAQWAGLYSQRTDQEAVSELQRRFYHQFGIDVATAQTLNRVDAENLIKRVRAI